MILLPQEPDHNKGFLTNPKSLNIGCISISGINAEVYYELLNTHQCFGNRNETLNI